MDYGTVQSEVWGKHCLDVSWRQNLHHDHNLLILWHIRLAALILWLRVAKCRGSVPTVPSAISEELWLRAGSGRLDILAPLSQMAPISSVYIYDMSGHSDSLLSSAHKYDNCRSPSCYLQGKSCGCARAAATTALTFPLPLLATSNLTLEVHLGLHRCELASYTWIHAQNRH